MNLSHNTLEEITTKNLTLRRIEHETSIVDIDKEGYNAFGNEWWHNLDCPFAFKYLSIDSLYPPVYFTKENVGHPIKTDITKLYDYMQEVYTSITGYKFQSVIELGAGDGEIASKFLEQKLDFITVEGTDAGYKALLAKKIPEEHILKCNLKFLSNQQRRFHLAMCTEVAEHIEPFFASKIVDNCISHSDFVWFSAADRHRKAHYHHMNEQPIEVWDNLFAHMGYPWYVILNQFVDRASRLYISELTGNHIFRNLT